MQAQSPRPVRTFTIGFHEADYNEAEHARAVARHLGTDHTELYVSPEEAQAVIPRLPEMYDEPFGDSSQIPTYLVASLARAARHRRAVGRWRRRAVRRIQPILPRRSGSGRASHRGRVGSRLGGAWHPGGFARGLGPSAGDRPAGASEDVTCGPHRRPDAQACQCAGRALLGGDVPQPGLQLGPAWRDPAVRPRNLERCSLPDHELPAQAGFVERMMYLDARTYLPDDIMVKVDRASMAVSLESRAPFLDHRVVELAWRVPTRAQAQARPGEVDSARHARSSRAARAGGAAQDGLRGTDRFMAAGPAQGVGGGAARCRLDSREMAFSIPPRSGGSGTNTRAAGGTGSILCGTCSCSRRGWLDDRCAIAISLGVFVTDLCSCASAPADADIGGPIRLGTWPSRADQLCRPRPLHPPPRYRGVRAVRAGIRGVALGQPCLSNG